MKFLDELLASVLKWAFSVLFMWCGFVFLHLAIEQVPSVSLLGASGIMIIIRAAAYGVNDLFVKKD